jgi:hypothetical protein
MPEIIDLGLIKLKFLQSGLIPAPAPTATVLHGTALAKIKASFRFD